MAATGASSGRRPATLLVFWDYDTQWGGDRSRMAHGPVQTGFDEMRNTDRLFELHAEHGIKGCFATVGSAALGGEPPYHNPGQVRRMHELGHEVASHSHRHEWLPGLNHAALRETLRSSKDALEQCIGAPVVSFVPPYNQPCDYPWKGSISLSERREAGPDRTGLERLCETLRETGYRFCRVVYWKMHLRIAERVLRRRLEWPAALEQIGGLTCVRLNTICGFDGHAMKMMERCADQGGIVVAYGHPHSLTAGNAQDERWLVPFFRRARQLADEGRLHIALPRELLAGSH